MIQEAYISIGSNIGDRRAYIERAVTAVSQLAEGEVRLSSVMETEPWGYEGGGAYLNMCMAFPTSLPPLSLLRQLLHIQNRIDPAPHRNSDGTYADRRIDIDFIALGDTVVRSPELILPHPRMHLRDFVLSPLAEIAPAWVHPLLHLTPAGMMAAFSEENAIFAETNKLHPL